MLDAPGQKGAIGNLVHDLLVQVVLRVIAALAYSTDDGNMWWL